MEKKCTSCNINKNIEDFYGKKSKCKECFKLLIKNRYLENKEKIIESRRKRREELKEIIKKEDSTKKCNECHEEKKLSCFTVRRAICKVCEKGRRKEYQKRNREKINERTRLYRENNPQIKEYDRNYALEWNKKNKDRVKESENKRRINPLYRMRKNLSRSISEKIKKGENKTAVELLGCTIEQYKKWMEYQFDENMSWNNYAEYWEIDHVKPKSSFNFEKDEEIRECFNWKNTRPLEKKENWRKNKKVDFKLIDEHKNIVSKFKLEYPDASMI